MSKVKKLEWSDHQEIKALVELLEYQSWHADGMYGGEVNGSMMRKAAELIAVLSKIKEKD